MSVLFVKQRIRVSEPLFSGGCLGVTYVIHLLYVGKLIVNFLLAINEDFSLALTAEALRRSRLF